MTNDNKNFFQKGVYKSEDGSQVIFATGRTGVGKHTKKPVFEGHCYYVETGLVEYSKTWLQEYFEYISPIRQY